MALQGSSHKVLRLFLVALILSIIFFSIFLYRFGLYDQFFDEDVYNSTLPHGSTQLRPISRIRSDEIRNHHPGRFHDPNEGPSEDTFRIAYIIAVHNKDTIEGAVQVLDQLFDAKHTFVIHLDAKSNNYTAKYLYDSLAKFKPSVDNPADPAHYSIKPQNNLVVLINHPISWCGFTIIQATFDMMSAALQTGRWFDSVVLLSGSCHPMKPPAIIEQKLKKLQGKLLLKLDGTGGSDDKGFKTKARYDHYFIDSYHKADRLPERLDEFSDVIKKNYPEDLSRRTGSQWVFLSREFTEYVITSPWVKKLFVAHSTSHCADESMFQLIANNSPFANNTFTAPTDDIKLRFEKWAKSQAHPSTLTEKTVLEAIEGPYLFARKFTAKPEVRSLVNRLAQQLWSGEPAEQPQ